MRGKWHFALNGGAVPLLETPSGVDSKHYVIFDSKIICDFIEAKYGGRMLYSSDPFQRAEQDFMISVFATIERNLTPVYLTRGKDRLALLELSKAFEKLEGWLINSKTGFFGFAIPTGSASASPHETPDPDYSMVDLYGFPLILRIYYSKGTDFEKKLYKKLFGEKKTYCPAIHRWVKLMLELKEF